MTALSFAERLYREFDQWKLPSFPSRKFQPEEYHRLIDNIFLSSPEAFKVAQVGESFEGRPLRLISAGSGSTRVLLWSQMHGDESTATMAIADILNYIGRHQNDANLRKILTELTISFLPILNPDGAATCIRRTAQGIDMNRDALALQTPEARLLKRLQQELKPAFGFNLHDQELSTVGQTKELTAIALLAPAFDHAKNDNDVRLREKKMTALFATVMEQFIPGKIARYDDTFEPRAFGDNMQKWGTSTMLIESGHALGDPEKQSIRKLNAVGIVATLHAIATGEYTGTGIATYERLPFNGKRAYDVIIRNILINTGNGTTTEANLGISYQVDTHSENPPRLVDLGDLQTFVGVKEVDGKRKIIPRNVLALGSAFEWERYV